MSQDARLLGPVQPVGPYTPGGTAFAETRGLIAGADCTADVVSEGVAVAGVPLNRGFNHIRVTKVTAVSTGTIFLAY